MLTGQLVRLRRVEPSDADNFYRWINDREVTQWLAARYPLSRTFEDDWATRASKQAPSDGHLSLLMETLAEGRPIGTIGLHGILLEDSHAELGIMIGESDYWGRGFGTDALVTLLRFAFEDMNLNRVGLQVLSENQRAIASYKKCGFVIEGTLRDDYYQGGRYHDIVAMGALASDFRALHGKKEGV